MCVRVCKHPTYLCIRCMIVSAHACICISAYPRIFICSKVTRTLWKENWDCCRFTTLCLLQRASNNKPTQLQDADSDSSEHVIHWHAAVLRAYACRANGSRSIKVIPTPPCTVLYSSCLNVSKMLTASTFVHATSLGICSMCRPVLGCSPLSRFFVQAAFVFSRTLLCKPCASHICVCATSLPLPDRTTRPCASSSSMSIYHLCVCLLDCLFACLSCCVFVYLCMWASVIYAYMWLCMCVSNVSVYPMYERVCSSVYLYSCVSTYLLLFGSTADLFIKNCDCSHFTAWLLLLWARTKKPMYRRLSTPYRLARCQCATQSRPAFPCQAHCLRSIFASRDTALPALRLTHWCVSVCVTLGTPCPRAVVIAFAWSHHVAVLSSGVILMLACTEWFAFTFAFCSGVISFFHIMCPMVLFHSCGHCSCTWQFIFFFSQQLSLC